MISNGSNANPGVITDHSNDKESTQASTSSLKRAETIECIVVRDDGQRMPADIDLCKFIICKS